MFDWRAYSAQAAVSWALDATIAFTTNGSNVNTAAIQSKAFYKGYKTGSDLAKVWLNTDYPDNFKEAATALVVAQRFLPLLGYPPSVADVLEGYWDIIYNAPPYLGSGTKEEFYEMLAQVAPDVFVSDGSTISLTQVASDMVYNPRGESEALTPDDFPEANQSTAPSEQSNNNNVTSVDGKVEGSKVRPSPLILDIDGGDVQLVSVESADAVYYDLNGDGIGTATGWTAGGDGFLAIDLNEDGVINNGTELFGDQTGYVNGFEALAVYDSNGDSAITFADDDWDKLVVWIDVNGNGFSEASELHGLDDLNITSIDLAYTQVDYAIAGNSIYQDSTFTMNGVSRTVVDAYFTVDHLNTTYVGEYTLDSATLFLPTARGYGNLPNLFISASLDNDQQDSGSLLSLLIDFADMDMSDIIAADTVAMEAVREIMFRWAGVEDVNPISRGPNVDARELGFLEAMTGKPFLQNGHTPNPLVNAGGDLSEAFQIAQNHFFSTLVAQTEARVLFNGNVYYDMAADGFEGFTGLDIDVLDDLETEASALATSAEREVFWKNVVRLIEYSIGTDNLDSADYTALEDAISSDMSLSLSIVLGNLLDNDPLNSISGTSGNDVLDGTAWNDEISGGTGDDTLSGLAGNDVLLGGNDNDILIGGSGDDFMNGGSGDDIYVYHLGDGTDIITEVNGNGIDKILFGSGITLNDLSFTRLGNEDLEILIDTGTETGKIMIAGQFAHIQHVVEQIEFDDSSTLDLTTVDYTIYSVGHKLPLYGVEIGGGNNDTIIAGTGLDELRGRSGDDTYIFGIGDAHVFGTGTSSASYSQVIEDYNEGTDVIHITGSVNPDDVRMWTGQYGALYVQYSQSDIIHVEGGWTTNGALRVGEKLEQIVFDDSTVWDMTQGLHLRNNDTARSIYATNYDDVIEAGAGGDILYGKQGGDTLVAGIGKDTLYGNEDDDTYVFGLGDAQVFGVGESSAYYSRIEENYNEGADTLHITDAVVPDDVYMWTGQYGALYIQYSETDTIYVGGGWTTNGALRVGEKLEQIVFDDSTVWDMTQGLHLRNNDTARSIYATNYDDVIEAGAGGDILYGKQGGDTLVAGIGKDTLYGNEDDDTYVFGLGDAQVFGVGESSAYYSRIEENYNEGADTLHITDAVVPDDVYMWTGQYGVLFIQYSEDDIIYVSGGSASNGATRVGERLEQITFDDQTVWDLTQGLHLKNNDTARSIHGSNYGDVIEAGASGDILYGKDGGDTLVAGTGKDTLYGDDGNDTYVFGLGDAQLFGSGTSSSHYNRISESYSEGTDTLHITGAVNPDDVYMWTDSSGHLYVKYSEDDIVYVQGGTSSSASRVSDKLEQIVFDDTTAWDLTAGLHLRNDDTARTLYGSNQNDTIEGGSGNDTLRGFVGDDLLIGHGGTDALWGYDGADTFAFMFEDVGNGIDTLRDFDMTEDDVIDLRDVLDGGYDPITDALADFVQFTNSGSHAALSVDLDGAGTTYGWTQIATVYNHNNLDPDVMAAAGNLLVA